jgi:hypothetical protein
MHTIKINYNHLQQLTIKDCLDSLHSDWTATVFSSSLSTTVIDLVQVSESLTTNNEVRITYE